MRNPRELLRGVAPRVRLGKWAACLIAPLRSFCCSPCVPKRPLFQPRRASRFCRCLAHKLSRQEARGLSSSQFGSPRNRLPYVEYFCSVFVLFSFCAHLRAALVCIRNFLFSAVTPISPSPLSRVLILLSVVSVENCWLASDKQWHAAVCASEIRLGILLN